MGGIESLKEGMQILAQHDDPEWWISQAVLKLTPDRLKEAIETNENAIISLFQTKYLNFPGVRRRSCAILDKNWNRVESLLLEPSKVRELLETIEGNAEIVETDEGIAYVNGMCYDAYYWIREFVYHEKKDLIEALRESSVMPLADFRQVANFYNIPEEMFTHILQDLQTGGVAEIYITITKQYQKEG